MFSLKKRFAAAAATVALAAGLLAGGQLAAAAAPETQVTGSADLLPDPVVVPLQVTGPATERLNFILLAEGYQADQQDLFMADVDRNLALFWATEPFKSYRNYINVYAVKIASIDYGVHCDPDGRVRHPDGTIRDTGEREGPLATKNTALRLTMSGCNDPLARGLTYGQAPQNCAAYADRYTDPAFACQNGNTARNRIIDTYVVPVIGIPRSAQNLQTLAIANTFTYAGIGGREATTSGGAPQGPSVSLHEVGHSLGTLVDEYPYSSRDVVRNCYTGNEPSSFHHTLRTAEQLVAQQAKWWRWVGEDSISGGVIGTWEGGGTYPCGQKRPSMGSMMRWISFDFDQIGLEHMVARVTGMRGSARMVVNNAAEGTVPAGSLLWVESGQPTNHDLIVTWRTEGPQGPILVQGANRTLDTGDYNLPEGTVVHVEVRDPVGPDGMDWVRNPSSNTTAADSGYNGARFVQSRTWTIGSDTVVASPAAAEITNSSLTTQPVGRNDIIFVNTNHHTDRAMRVVWKLNGSEVQSGPLTNLDLSKVAMAEGTHTLEVTVSDPTSASTSVTRTWTVDAIMPTTPRTLSEPLATMPEDPEHGIYFNGWDMWLEPQDSTEGYESQRYVNGQLKLNDGGWFAYYGFPEQPMPEAPFQFRHSGTVIKALTYGNLGSGGLSKAGFEQTLPDEHPAGGFVPGFGTHTVQHRSIDPAGNVAEPESYNATALPGNLLTCDTTVTGEQASVAATTGVTCVTDATVSGNVTVAAGASVLVQDSAVAGQVIATDAAAVQVINSEVAGATRIVGTTADVTLVGNTFNAGVTLNDNVQVSANERFSRLAYAYGPVLAGNTIYGALKCADNSAAAADFGATNAVSGDNTGDCAELETTEISVPAFGDVSESNQFAADIAWMANNGISTGTATENGADFKPSEAVSRQAFAAFLYRMEFNGAKAPACTSAPYSDVPVSSQFCGEIAWLKSQNITTGFPNNTFRGSSTIERQAMAAFLYRYATGNVTAPACTEDAFTDVPAAATFCGEIAWLKASGITTGYANGSFQPGGTVQRQAAAAFLHRLSTLES